MADVKKPENEQLDINGENPTPDKVAEEAAALTKEETPPKGDNVVTYDFTAKSETTQSAEKTEQTPKPPEEKPKRGRPPNPDKTEKTPTAEKDPKADDKKQPEKKTPEEKPARKGRPPKDDKNGLQFAEHETPNLKH